jgi:hypothetical protein
MHGRRATSSLTEAGIRALPVMVAMGQLGPRHSDGTRRLRVRAELLRDGRPGLVERFVDELRGPLGIPLSDPTGPGERAAAGGVRGRDDWRPWSVVAGPRLA